MAGWILFITIANELIDRYMEEHFIANNGWIQIYGLMNGSFCRNDWMDGCRQMDGWMNELRY